MLFVICNGKMASLGRAVTLTPCWFCYWSGIEKEKETPLRLKGRKWVAFQSGIELGRPNNWVNCSLSCSSAQSWPMFLLQTARSRLFIIIRLRSDVVSRSLVSVRRTVVPQSRGHCVTWARWRHQQRSRVPTAAGGRCDVRCDVRPGADVVIDDVSLRQRRARWSDAVVDCDVEESEVDVAGLSRWATRRSDIVVQTSGDVVQTWRVVHCLSLSAISTQHRYDAPTPQFYRTLLLTNESRLSIFCTVSILSLKCRFCRLLLANVYFIFIKKTLTPSLSLSPWWLRLKSTANGVECILRPINESFGNKSCNTKQKIHVSSFSIPYTLRHKTLYLLS